MDERTSPATKARFGVPGLDDILNGGLARNRLYLMEGAPGSGKTTLALQFLIEGANAGEKGLYITLSETEQELRETAASHNWTVPKTIDIFELVPPESLLDEKQQQSLLYSSDLELGETTTRIFEAMDRSKPSRPRCAGIRWRQRVHNGEGLVSTLFDTTSERALILAPQGRDSNIAADVLREGGLVAEICNDLPGLTEHADLRSLAAWVQAQPQIVAGAADRVIGQQRHAAVVGFSVHFVDRTRCWTGAESCCVKGNDSSRQRRVFGKAISSDNPPQCCADRIAWAAAPIRSPRAARSSPCE